MKAIAIVLFSILMLRGCDKDTIRDLNDAEIEYTATTRGFYRHVNAKGGTVKVWKDRARKETPATYTLSNEQKKELLNAFNELALDEIPTYKAPSERRFYDGAAIATLKITYKGETYESQAFDHRNPPAEIERVVSILEEYTEDNE